VICFEEALTKILEAVSPLGLENVNILEGPGRVIGEDIRCDRAIPPEDRSAMDGYALRAGDTEGAGQENPVRLEVIEEIPAGNMPAKRIGPGQAARIMTGAPLPDGADAVVRMEDCRRENGRVAVLVEAVQGRAVRLAAENLRQNTQDISFEKAGTVIIVDRKKPDKVMPH
jgi:molybdopterin molybdotransferase